MKKYTFECTCGDKMSVDATDMDDARVKLAEMMPEDAMKGHFAKKHSGQTVPLYEDFMAAVELVEEPVAESPMAN